MLHTGFDLQVFDHQQHQEPGKHNKHQTTDVHIETTSRSCFHNAGTEISLTPQTHARTKQNNKPTNKQQTNKQTQQKTQPHETAQTIKAQLPKARKIDQNKEPNETTKQRDKQTNS